MKNKFYKKAILETLDTIKCEFPTNSHFIINHANLFFILSKTFYILSKNIKNNIIIINDQFKNDIVDVIKKINKSYFIIQNINDIEQYIINITENSTVYDYVLLYNTKQYYIALNSFLEHFNLGSKSNNLYQLYHIFFYYMQNQPKKFNNVFLYNIMDINFKTIYHYTNNKNTLLLQIDLPIKAENIYLFNDVKTYLYNAFNLINYTQITEYKLNLSKYIYINEYKITDTLIRCNTRNDIQYIKDLLNYNNVDDVVNYENKLISTFHLQQYDSFNLLFNKLVPSFYYQNLNLLKHLNTIISNLINDETYKNSQLNTNTLNEFYYQNTNQKYYNCYTNLYNYLDLIFIELFDIYNISFIIKNNTDFLNILDKYLKFTIYTIQNIIDRCKKNIEENTCSICYEDINNQFILFTCCQIVMCISCSIKSTYKKDIKLYNIFMGKCPYCKASLDLENDLILIKNKSILHQMKLQTKPKKIHHVHKKNIINFINCIIKNKHPKYLKTLQTQKIDCLTINKRIIFNQFSLTTKNYKNFIIVLNNFKQFIITIEKLILYEYDFSIFSPSLNVFDVINYNMNRDIYVANLTSANYYSFINVIINIFTHSKYISNVIILKPNKINNTLIQNIIYNITSHCNIYILDLM